MPVPQDGVVPVPQVTVVGLGPGRPGLVTEEAAAAIEAGTARWLRTTRHPSAGVVPGASSFDHLYESAATLDDVYAGIVETLVGSALDGERVVYAVPGSPTVAERSVELLRADPRVTTVVLPGVSFADLAFERLGVDPLAAGVRLVDGHRFGVGSAGYAGPMLVGQCDSAQVLSDVKLAIGAVFDQTGASGGPAPGGSISGGPASGGGETGFRVTVLQRLGLPDESVVSVAWDDLDRVVVPDHLTSLWVPSLGLAFASEMVRLEEIGRTLRARCPWDREQTHQSLTRYLIEES